MTQMTKCTTAGILIPTCDRPAYLELSLHSACSQSVNGIEIIVIDNGTSSVAENLVSLLDDPRVRYVRNETDLGLTGSIRKGVRLFTDNVRWCTILPDDDLLDHHYIRSMLDYTGRYSGIEVAHGQWRLIDARGIALGETPLPPERESAVEYLVGRSRFVRKSFLAGVFFDRSAYEQLGGYPQFTTGMASDDALIFGLSLRKGLYFNKEAIASVRMHPEAESHSSSNVQKHIQAFGDLHRYIVRISTADDRLSEDDLSTIRKAVDTYTRLSINGLWVHRVLDLLSGRIPAPERELSTLYGLARNRSLPFSIRARVDAYCATYLGWNPETNPYYRHFWENRHRKRTHYGR
ncbi:MAG: glycosyltransferase family 2 protein [Nitrospirota bacterium]